MGGVGNFIPRMQRSQIYTISKGIRDLLLRSKVQMYPPCLTGACTLVSALIADALFQVHGEPTTIVGGTFRVDKYDGDILYDSYRDYHNWLTWNGYIVDATATQFGVEDEVYITDNDDRYLKQESIPIHSFGVFNKNNVWIEMWLGWSNEYELLIRQSRKIAENI